MNQSEENQWFTETLKSGERAFTDPGFEGRVLKQLRKEDQVLSTITRYKKISLLMLATGILIGLLLPWLISWIGQSLTSGGHRDYSFSINLLVTIGIIVVFSFLLKESWPKNGSRITNHD